MLYLNLVDMSKRTEYQKEYCLSYHDPDSITWSWILLWTPPWRIEYCDLKLSWKVKLFGCWFFKSQEKMLHKLK